MAWFDDYGIEEEELEEGVDNKIVVPERDALIFLIDCNSSMLEPMTGSTESAVQLCLRCAKNVQQTKIISSDKDLAAIVLYGTKLSSQFMQGVFVLQSLDQPDAERIKSLEALIEKNKDGLDEEFGCGQDYSFADALWTCQKLFSESSVSLGYKRILLFTNEDDPHSTNPHLRRGAFTRMDDLRQNNVELELIHLEPPDGRTFSVEPFFKDLLVTADDEMTALPDPSQRFEELLSRVKSKDHKKRALTRLPFSLGDNLELHVGVYNLVRSCPMPTAVRLDQRTNEELKRQSRVFLSETAEMLLPQDLKRSIEFAKRQIYFETHEVAEIKHLAPSGLKLLGFKPRSFLKNHYHVRASQFLYPDEKTIEGSTTLFSALLKKCLDREVVPLCRFVPRANAAPANVVLLPQAETKNENGVQERPPGFHIIFLPYADDLRSLSLPKFQEAEPEQVDAAKEMVKKLTVKFDPENFENPKLQTFYSNLEAMALDRDAPEAIEDHTEPDNALIQSRAGQAIEAFKKSVDWCDANAKKRTSGDGGAAAKKARLDSAAAIDLGAEARAGRLAKLTVPVLKEAMRSAGIRAAGTRKADLLEAINSHFDVN